MEFKEFERLYLGDRVMLMLAMELFLENGREKLKACTQQELSAGVAPKLSGLLTLDRIDAVAQTAKELAVLETKDLLSYIARCFGGSKKK